MYLFTLKRINFFFSRPQVVKERMLCHAIIGRAGGKELIMKVAVNCEFIAPLLEFSMDNVFFRVDKVGVAQSIIRIETCLMTCDDWLAVDFKVLIYK